MKQKIKKIIVYGAGEHGKVVADSVLSIPDYKLIGFIDDNKTLASLILGHKMLGGKEYLLNGNCNGSYLAIGFGSISVREKAKLFLDHLNISVISIIDPTAIISPFATVGIGSYIGKNVVLNTNAIVKKYCIINTSAIIEHDCIIEDFAEISVNACLGGSVQVGEKSFIGIGANVRDHIKIGSNSVIGVGATVTKNIDDYGMYYGNPARKIKDL